METKGLFVSNPNQSKHDLHDEREVDFADGG